MLVDSADNVYLGYLGVNTGSSPLVNLWQLFKINTASIALTFTASMSMTNYRKDASNRANIYDIIFSADTSIILIAAALVRDEDLRYYAGIYGINGNDARMSFSFTDNDFINYMRFTNIANYKLGT
jgi:hypothetical protein